MTDILVSGMSFYILFIYFMSQSFFSVIAFNLQRCIVTKCGLIFLVFVFAACSQTQKLIVGNIVVFNPTYKRARVKQASSVFPRSPLTLCHSVSPLNLYHSRSSSLTSHACCVMSLLTDWIHWACAMPGEQRDKMKPELCICKSSHFWKCCHL